MSSPRPPDDATQPPDLRFTSREDQGVTIDRDLSGTGHLARGSQTNMSLIRMSVRAQRREYLDPHLAALREAGDVQSSAAAAAVPVLQVAPTADSRASAEPQPQVDATERLSVFDRIAAAIRRGPAGR